MTTLYRPYVQQILMGDDRVGFRDADDEPWLIFYAGRHGAVLSHSGPLPHWLPPITGAVDYIDPA